MNKLSGNALELGVTMINGVVLVFKQQTRIKTKLVLRMDSTSMNSTNCTLNTFGKNYICTKSIQAFFFSPPKI